MGPTAAAQVGEALLALALSRPDDALRRSSHLIAGSPDTGTASYAHQAAGIVHRDRGDTDTALSELRVALSYAVKSRDDARITDVRATLGATLVASGRSVAGLTQLDLAEQQAAGLLRARVLLRRAHSRFSLGWHVEALDDLQDAVVTFRKHGDELWEARTLANRARIHQARGSLMRAQQDAAAAQQLFARLDQHLEQIDALHTLGAISFLRGDLPLALTQFDEAAKGFAGTGVSPANFVHDRCQLLLMAGLNDDALEVAEDCLRDQPLVAVERAHLLLICATAAFAVGDLDLTTRRARTARTAFTRQHRPWWRLLSDLLLVQVACAAGGRGARLSQLSSRVAAELVESGADEAALALLLAGDLATDHQDAQAHYLAAARYRRHPSAVLAATGWLALARLRSLTGSSRGVLSAVERGLAALDEHRARLGSTELRALSTQHGSELADLAVRHAAATGGPRRLLAWSERWRATALAQAPVRPGDDEVDGLDAVRAAQRSLDEALRDGDDPTEIARERRELERRVRAQRHSLAGRRPPTPPTPRPGVPEVLDALRDGPDGCTTLVELVVVDGTVRALVARAGRVRGFVVGPVAEATDAVRAARFVLRQSARGRPSDLVGLGARLERTLLGPAADALGEGPVVVSPPAHLHATPWGLLPSLARRPLSVAPSAATWVRAGQRDPAGHTGLVLVGGPGLPSDGAEIDVLAAENPGATLLRGADATVDATLAALDGALLAHVAAHGHFRSDSPMFSSLSLADGPLTVHHLELLHRPPHRFILSACDSGVMVPVGADELLGLSAALLSLGT
uniref:CHAT domain-containing protein n=1 Tax=Nocardioides sp. TaxID=35761 RepID=UPI002B26C828